MAGPPPTYTREEMDAILKRALERQQQQEKADGGDGIGHEDLVEAAGEVGIPREEVEAAARELAEQKAKQSAPAPVRDETGDGDALGPSDARKREIRLFFGRATYFGIITAVLFVISGMHWNGWWLWAALGFGLSLARSAIRIVFGDEADPARRSERRIPRRERREQRRLRREETMAEFERKVAIGADALLRVIDEARRMRVQGQGRDVVERAPPRPEPAGPRVIVTPAPPVRVDSRENEHAEGDEEAGPAGARQKRVP